MIQRELYIDRYKKVFNHLKTNSEQEKKDLEECQKLLIKAINNEGLDKECYFNQIDFILNNTFDIQIYIEP